MKEQIKRTLKSTSLGRKAYPILEKWYQKAVSHPARRARLQQFGGEMLKKFHEVFVEAKIPYFVDFGTLLGLVRDGKFIANDCDVDLTIASSGPRPDEVLSLLLSHGFNFVHAFLCEGRVVEMTVSWNRLTADIYFYTYDQKRNENWIAIAYWDPDRKYVRAEENSYRRNYFPISIETKNLDVLGLTVSIPQDSDAHLKLEYGPSWRTPDARWDSSYAPNCENMPGVAVCVHDRSMVK